MLLRSSSTPVLGSLLLSFSDSPNNNTHSETNITKHRPTTIHHSLNKLSFHQTGSLNLPTFSCNSSPIAELSDLNRQSHSRGFRRAQSEGNLEGLASASCNSYDELCDSDPPQKFPRRPKCSMLQTIPSFSVYSSRNGYEVDSDEEEEEQEEEREELEGNSAVMERSVNDGEKFMAMGLVGEKGFMSGIGNVGFEDERELVSSEMYLAKGLGVNGGGFGSGGGGGGDFTPGESGRDGGDGNGPHIEEYYRRMVEGNPGNTLFLRNYAQFLYQSKQDLQGAEEYYSRAILADPKDGEILSQYAKLVWELHHDQDRASSYFERAVQAAPEDSHVLAAYAGFLWETEEDEDEDNAPKDLHAMPPLFRKGAMVSSSV